MEAHIPEGLQHNSVENITALISDSGFNCVRLTWSIEMALNQGLQVSDSFGTLASRTNAPADAVENLWNRVVEKNPWIQGATVIEAFGKVVDMLGSKNLRVMLDNHVSKASWCCNLEDGNGFWDEARGYLDANSRFFRTEEWLEALEAMAKFSAFHPAVAGIGLRNEIRESGLQFLTSRSDWYTYVARGATAVHNANKDLLIAVGGVLSSTDASFLRTSPFDRSPYGDKVVWEWHTYTFSPTWITTGGNCALWKQAVGGFTGFLLAQGQGYTGPLWLSEFGFSMSAGGPPERSGLDEDAFNYVQCLIEYLTSNDGDWALWAIQGNYYVRDGNVDSDEPWGLLNTGWSAWRNPAVKQLLGAIWDVTQHP
ncbi:hypothetical protein E1B28_011494 [Marasmius oreades]|uniref:Glycoside hydrolase family 5 domain-containing protein n=1 Tax=Marasmius oreades TaxID=181124 RepID=A0A9P7RUD2_9AGAR|nr:uncharacterized protein E1B28_011494 [Marasmius oreades]KAG7089850.1 hypothetical protein E1B28_011494 [Marasmius oreades]